MVKWFSITAVLVWASLLNAQWAQAPGYPQSQYPTDQNPQAQQSQQAPDAADLQHGVARISIAQGDVNVQRGDNGQLSAAVINTPLMTRDHVQTSDGSRAEVQLDAATLLRLAPNSDVGFADLEYHRAQVQLALGTVIFEVLQNSPTQVEIDTPSVGIRALSPGEYRISVFDNGTSQITVRSGQLEVSGPRGSEHLEAGRSILVRGDASDPEMQEVSAPVPDQFDEWSHERNREFVPTQSYQYVNADMQGAGDLDRYGNWVPSGYGQVWRPQGVSPDWAPYSDGQWSYVDYYGWSWIDYAPWGWAPYHYGRWFWNTGYGWCWWPGGRLYPAYWRPALVGFFGFGDGLGWVALAPYELFHPWWGRGGYGFGFGFAAGFGLNGYRNAAFRGGALYASYRAFGGIHEHFAFASRSQIAGAHLISGRLPVTATRASYSYSNRQPFSNSRFAAVQNRSFFSQGMQARSFAASSSNHGGWQRFGAPGPALRQRFQGNESSPWHSFGQSNANSYRATPQYNNSFRQSYQQPRSSYSAPRQSYSAPRQSYSAPRQSYSAPRQSYSAPRQSYSAPRQSQPHYSAPSGHSGGGGGSHGGGGGGHHGR